MAVRPLIKIEINLISKITLLRVINYLIGPILKISYFTQFFMVYLDKRFFTMVLSYVIPTDRFQLYSSDLKTGINFYHPILLI